MAGFFILNQYILSLKLNFCKVTKCAVKPMNINFNAKKKFLILFPLIFSLTLISCKKQNSTQPVDDNLDAEIGQMLMVGFKGLTITPENPVVNDLTNLNIGGVVLYDKDVPTNSYGRNIESPEQLKKLTAQLKKYSPNLLIAIDQEGGVVNRLKTGYGFPASVSEEYLGDLNNPDSTTKYAGITAATLEEMGINVNFAPVVDLNINPNNPVIGKLKRSFSADPSVVTSNSEEMIKTFHKHKVLASLKHFPGHGSSQSDSHLGFTDVTNTWQPVELEPYKNLIEKNYADLIMTAHIFNANLDSTFPATLSKPIITGILRDSLNYDGIVVSDDMQMGAIADHYGLETAIYNSINAGVDIILFSNNSVFDPQIAQKSIEIIKKLINDGKISRERIDKSYQRIIKLKSRIN